MTKEQYYNLEPGGKVKDAITGEVGYIMVYSRGEVYVQYPSAPDYLVGYCDDEDDEPWTRIEIA